MANKKEEPRKKISPKNFDEIDRQAREAVKKIFDEMRTEKNKGEEQILPPPPTRSAPLFSNPNLGAWNDFLKKVEEEARAMETEQEKTLVQDIASILIPVFKAQDSAVNEKINRIDNNLANLARANCDDANLAATRFNKQCKDFETIEESHRFIKRDTNTIICKLNNISDYIENKTKIAEQKVKKYEKWFVLGMCVPALLGILNLILLLSQH